MTGFFRFARRAALAMAMLAGGALVTYDEASARAGHGGARSGGHVSRGFSGGQRGFSGHRGFAPQRSFAPRSFAPRAVYRPARIARPYYAPRRHFRRSYRAPAYYGGYYAPAYYGRYCVIKKRWAFTPWGWRKIRKRVCY